MEIKNYVSPEFRIADMEIEGVLCASLTDATQNFSNGLQDYNPSEGAW